jgi:sugar/nucleoside kinase (ribokinase family)
MSPRVTSLRPGGATQNSIRVAQWLLKLPQAVTFFGCVGSDKDGNKLEEVAEEGGEIETDSWTD